ncbi:MAG: signal peptidase II [Candidatus Omnitrophica bacterium]|nr:signal peptidase II [Candidatus Omnitrophota bacterium]
MTLLFLIASVVVVIDRFTKYLVFNNLSEDQTVEVISRVFHITLVLNTGSAFGLFKSFGAFFIVSSFFIIALIVIYILQCKHKDLVVSVALGLILGGAIGNLIDRIAFGYVIDFLDFRVWPVFNIADSSITAGAVLLASRFFFE